MSPAEDPGSVFLYDAENLAILDGQAKKDADG
jgi:hypothetical protein